MFLRNFLSLFLIFSIVFTIHAQESSSEGRPEQEKKKETQVEKSTQSVEKEEKSSEQSGEYDIKLRTLEEKINSLKDKIFRAKQRLSILQETVLQGAITGARATVVHKNRVGGAFELVSAIYYLDEAPIFKKIDSPRDLSKKDIVVFDGSIVPGPHHVSAYLIYRGKGFGIFSYMEGYTFKVKTGYSFNVEEGRIVELSSVSKDKGGAEKLENRLHVEFDLKEKAYEGQGEAGVNKNRGEEDVSNN